MFFGKYEKNPFQVLCCPFSFIQVCWKEKPKWKSYLQENYLGTSIDKSCKILTTLSSISRKRESWQSVPLLCIIGVVLTCMERDCVSQQSVPLLCIAGVVLTCMEPYCPQMTRDSWLSSLWLEWAVWVPEWSKFNLRWLHTEGWEQMPTSLALGISEPLGWFLRLHCGREDKIQLIRPFISANFPLFQWQEIWSWVWVRSFVSCLQWIFFKSSIVYMSWILTLILKCPIFNLAKNYFY